jgi:tripartite-type tricarboxylate transporter receptor subunit TctC
MLKKVIAIMTLILASHAHAWEPNGPVKAFIGFGPGSGNEIAFRGVAAEVERNNPKVNFVIQTMPGAGGNIALAHAVKLPADGMTFTVSGLSTYAFDPVFYPELMKFTQGDLYPVLGIARSPFVIVARPSSKVNTVKELAAHLKSGEQVFIGISGAAPFLVHSMLMEKAGGNYDTVQTVMYKGPQESAMAAATGEVEFSIMPVTVSAPLIAGGKVKLIGLVGDKKMPQFPNAELVKDTLPGVVFNAMWNITLPKDTPKDVVDWYVAEFGKAIHSENVKKYFDQNYMYADPFNEPVSHAKWIATFKSQIMPVAEKAKPRFR